MNHVKDPSSFKDLHTTNGRKSQKFKEIADERRLLELNNSISEYLGEVVLDLQNTLSSPKFIYNYIRAVIQQTLESCGNIL